MGGIIKRIWLALAPPRLPLHDHAGRFPRLHHQRKGKGSYPIAAFGALDSAKIYRRVQARRHQGFSHAMLADGEHYAESLSM